MTIFDKFEIVGHRGACAYAPENTIQSFLYALEIGATSVELDLRVTKDKEIVVIHDASIDRTTDHTGLVSQMMLTEIKKANAGSWFAEKFASERIPTFNEVIEAIGGRAGILVEIKDDPIWDDTEICENVVQHIVDHNMIKDVEIISFNHAIVESFSSLCPELCSGILYRESPADILNYTRGIGASVVHPFPMPGTDLVEGIDIKWFQENGLKVLATSQDEIEMQGLISNGVDGICTNYIDRIVNILANNDKF